MFQIWKSTQGSIGDYNLPVYICCSLSWVMPSTEYLSAKFFPSYRRICWKHWEACDWEPLSFLESPVQRVITHREILAFRGRGQMLPQALGILGPTTPYVSELFQSPFSRLLSWWVELFNSRSTLIFKRESWVSISNNHILLSLR